MSKWLHKSIKWFLIASLPLALLITIILGYWLKWDWTGFIGGHNKVTVTETIHGTTKTTEESQGKSLWDWLNLLAIFLIPAAVGFGTLWFTAQQNKTQDAENEDNQRERALQEYIDKISDLLLKENLRESIPTLSVDSQLVLKGLDTKPDEEVRTIARARTLTALSRLDGDRKKEVLEYLYELGLLNGEEPIISLQGAYLRDAKLYRVNLSSANLSGAGFGGAYLRHADLRGTNFFCTYLGHADLSNANLVGADLSGAYLVYADLSTAFLDGADFRRANLILADLGRANLCGADLSGADLSGADLNGANLTRAKLTEAVLTGAKLVANLMGADLSGANLAGAKVTQEQLNQAKSLKGATMPDGSKHS